MKKIIIAILMISIPIWSFSQQNYKNREYGKIVYNLFSLNHKAVSYNIGDPSIITTKDLEVKTNKEDIVVYFVYEINSELKNTTLMDTKPINKLMDFYIIYDYRYRIYYANKEELSSKIPMIKLAEGSTLTKTTIKNHFINEKGKLDEKQLKKSAFNFENTKGLLSIKIDENTLTDNSLLEIQAKVLSRNFLIIQPSISDIESFEKQLVVSFPSIFSYKIQSFNSYKLTSQNTSNFELLNFINSLNRNGEIEKINTISHIYTWKIELQSTSDLEPEFELDGINFPPKTDIGITKNEILHLKQ